MGKRTAPVVVWLGIASALLSITAVLLPLHVVEFYTGELRIASLEIFAVQAVFAAQGSQFCRALPEEFQGQHVPHVEREAFCPGQNAERRRGLESSIRFWCAPTMKLLWPQFCMGMENAYGVGLFVILVVCTGVIAQLIACFLVLDYTKRRPGKSTRKTAEGMVAATFLVTAASLLAYAYAVTLRCDTIGARLGVLGVPFVARKATGFSYGQLLLWLAVVVQGVELAFCGRIRVEAEDRLRETGGVRELGLEMVSPSVARYPSMMVTAPGALLPEGGARLEAPGVDVVGHLPSFEVPRIQVRAATNTTSHLPHGLDPLVIR